MIPLGEAQQTIDRVVESVSDSERVPLERSVGRILAEEPCADAEQPAFDRVTMDGFAVRSQDLPEPGTLQCIGLRTAGSMAGDRVGAGQCLEIMTGAPLPAGADAVVPVERTDRDGDRVQFAIGVVAGQNVHPRGCDLARGARPLAAGTRITTATLPLLATLGRREVVVRRVPKVAVLASGDELVDPDQQPGPGQIRDSNRFALAAQVESAGAEPWLLPRVADDERAMERAVAQALESDVVLLTGGSSVGKKDFSKDVVARTGARCHFDRVAIKPGKPVQFFDLGEKIVFCLPGNPVSAFVTFEVLVRPALERRAGSQAVWPTPIRLSCLDELKAPAARQILQIAELCTTDATWGVRPLRWSGSGDLVTLHRANALVSLPAGGVAGVGDRVDSYPLRHRSEAFPRSERVEVERDEG